MKMDDIEPVMLESTNRRLAAACIGVTSYIVTVVFNDMRDPITGEVVDLDLVLEICEFVNDVNDAVGNEPSPTFTAAIRALHQKAAGKVREDGTS